jgi:hypothetical protein
LTTKIIVPDNSDLMKGKTDKLKINSTFEEVIKLAVKDKKKTKGKPVKKTDKKKAN